METGPESHATGVPSASHQVICGFWRRFLAFLLDAILLGLVGLLLGQLLFDFLAQLGGWGRLFGFCVTLLYFGVLNSTVGKGQTLGKRILQIAVVQKTGSSIPVGLSYLRSAVLAAPFFMNEILFPPSVVLIGITGTVVFGLGGATLYLYAFNRSTRQSVHDLVAGTFVVKTSSAGEVPRSLVWRPHLVLIGVWSLLVIVAFWVRPQFVQDRSLNELIAVQESIQGTGKYHVVSVADGTSQEYSSKGSSKRTRVSVKAILRLRPDDYEAAANEIATTVLREYPKSEDRDALEIRVMYGYDIGIAEDWEDYSFSKSSKAWRRDPSKMPSTDQREK